MWQVSFHAVVGIIAGVISLFGIIIYARGTLIGASKPSRITWGIWTLNSAILLAGYDATGADETIWLAVAYTIGCFIIALLTIKFGKGGWGRLDRICLIGTILAILGWWATGLPSVAFLATLVIDLCGVLPTIEKAWKEPDEEDKSAWGIMFVGGLASLLAIDNWSFTVESLTIAAYPFQISITTGIIVFFLTQRHKANSKPRRIRGD